MINTFFRIMAKCGGKAYKVNCIGNDSSLNFLVIRMFAMLLSLHFINLKCFIITKICMQYKSHDMLRQVTGTKMNRAT